MELISFRVNVLETNILIKANINLERKAREVVLKHRSLLENYIKKDPFFKETFSPYKIDKDAPSIVKAMVMAAFKAGVGPMAAVAGTIAEFVGRELLSHTSEIIVENGGDIFIKTKTPKLIGIYAGRSLLSGAIAIEIFPEMMPLGICTSSGTFGHSKSLGKADAVVVLSRSTPLADAVATKICNIIKDGADIPKGIDEAKAITGIEGVVIIKEKDLGVWGDVVLKCLQKE